MANYNLTAQQIKDTFEQLAQVSASIEGGVAGSAVLDGTGSRVNILHATATTATSASFATTALSASYAPNTGVTSIIAGTNVSIDQSTGDVTISATGGGGSTDTGSLLVTASNVDATITYTKGDGSTFENIINNVAFATEAEDLVITVKNTSGGTLAKGTAVHAVSVTGENVNVIAASNDSAAAMPAIGLLSAQLTDNSAGTCIIAGRETGIDTSGLIAGASVYVSTGGALTATKPTGSALIQNIGTAAKINASGEIIVQGSGRTNDLPNIAFNHVWVGDTDSVPQATSVAGLDVLSAFSATSASYALTASVVTDPNVAYINKNNSFTGTQTFNNINVNGTGSFAYIESVTGSAKTIGDAFIILNNDTPTQVYAGVKVQDSGSTTATASLQWDGTNDQWFFEKEVSGTGEFGVFMGGPEYSDISSPAYISSNRIPKGDGGHHFNDSSITDNGTGVTVSTSVTSSNGFSSTGFSKPSTFNGDVSAFSLTTTGAVTAKASFSTTAGFELGEVGTPKKTGYYKVHSDAGSWSGAGNAAGIYVVDANQSDAFVGTIGNFGNPYDAANTASFVIQGGANADSNYSNTIMYASEADGFPHFVKSTYFDKPVIISSSLEHTGSMDIDGAVVATGNITGNNITANGFLYSVAGAVTSGTGLQAGYGGTSGTVTIKNSTGGGLQFPTMDAKTNTTDFTQVFSALRVSDSSPTGSSPAQPVSIELTSYTGKDGGFPVSQLRLGPNQGASGVNTVMWSSENYPWVTFDKSVHFESPVTSSAIISASAGIIAGATSTFNNVDVDGTLQVTGSLQYEGTSTGKQQTLSIVSNTASLDPSTGDYFTLTLVSGSNTVVDVGYSDAGRGTTFILESKQPAPAGGTIEFINAKFPGGVAPTASPAGTDIFTFVGINGADSYGVQTANFI